MGDKTHRVVAGLADLSMTYRLGLDRPKCNLVWDLRFALVFWFLQVLVSFSVCKVSTMQAGPCDPVVLIFKLYCNISFGHYAISAYIFLESTAHDKDPIIMAHRKSWTRLLDCFAESEAGGAVESFSTSSKNEPRNMWLRTPTLIYSTSTPRIFPNSSYSFNNIVVIPCLNSSF